MATCWEYTRAIVSLDGKVLSVDGVKQHLQPSVDEFLKEMGESEWELCGDGLAVPSMLISGYSQIQYLFKKPLR